MVNWKKTIGLIAIITIVLAIATIEWAVFNYYGPKSAQEPVKTEFEKTITAKGLNVEFIFRENPLSETEETINKSTLALYYPADKFIDSIQSKARVYSSLTADRYSSSVKKTYWTFVPDHAGFIVYKIIYEQNQQISVPDGYSIHSLTALNQYEINYEYERSENVFEIIFAIFLIFGTPTIGTYCIIFIYKKISKKL
jgi:hypothetical protein